MRSWKFAEEKREHQKKLERHVSRTAAGDASRYANWQQICAGHPRELRAALLHLADVRPADGDQARGLAARLRAPAVRRAQQREYLQATNPDEIKREIAQLQKDMPQRSAKVQEINRKRIEILNKRLEKYDKIAENRQVIDAQCAAIEDVLQLIRDQSVTMRDPQQISDQLDNLVQDVEQTEETVQRGRIDLRAIATPDLNAPMSLDDRRDDLRTRSRSRIRN